MMKIVKLISSLSEGQKQQKYGLYIFGIVLFVLNAPNGLSINFMIFGFINLQSVI